MANSASGLFTTEGRAIVLFEEGPALITGRYDDAGGSVEDTDPIAFAIHVDPATGVIYLAQWTSLDHGTEAPGLGQPSYDEALTFAAGRVTLRAEVTDFDGDTTRSALDLANRVFFEDDGPLTANDNELLGTGTVGTGNVLTDASPGDSVGDTDTGADNTGADGGKVTRIASTNGNFDDTPTAGAFSVIGVLGTLAINEDGSYTYTRSSTSGGNDTFTYTLTDGDNDKTTATLTITLDPQTPPPGQGIGIRRRGRGRAARPCGRAGVPGPLRRQRRQDDCGRLRHDDTGPGHNSTSPRIRIINGNSFNVTGGLAPLDFHFVAGPDGDNALVAGGGNMTSGGQAVLLHVPAATR